MPAKKGKEATQGTQSSKVASKAVAMKLTPAQKKKLDVGSYNLQVDLTAAAEKLKAKMLKEEKDNPVSDEQWCLYFYDYIKDIYNNIDNYLSKIPGGAILTQIYLDNTKLIDGGYDEAFSNQDSINYNIGLYTTLFKQFKDKTNTVYNCKRVNELLSWIGDAVLRLIANYNSISLISLIDFCKKIAVILEIAVYPEAFFYYITGDSSGKKEKILPRFAPNEWYKGIWIRKQEYLGVISSSHGKDYLKKYDSGLRIFVRNYIRRLIDYMRKYDENYPLTHAQVYSYGIQIHTYSLPKDGIFPEAPPKQDYIISPEDWGKIPKFLLPDGAAQLSFAKNHKPLNQWHNPPPDWWIERTKELLGGYEWWNNSDDNDRDKHQARLEGDDKKNLAKWKALNHILPENYELYSTAWDLEWDDEHPDSANGVRGVVGGGGSPRTLTNKKKRFQILKDKEIALPPKICKELKSKLLEYFRLNIVEPDTNKIRDDKYTEGYLRDGNYINNLNTSIISRSSRSLRPVSEPLRQLRPTSAIPLRPASEGKLPQNVFSFYDAKPPRIALDKPLKIKTNSKNNRGSSSASSADTVYSPK